MPATQIPQGSSSTLNAPALRLGEVTTDEVIFIGPAISLTEDVTTPLPYTLTTAPAGWTIIVTSAVAGESCTFSVTVPLAAATTTGGGYNLTYFDASGDLYSVWFDVILAGDVPVPEVPLQLLQGQSSLLDVPLLALSYKSPFISVESPKEGTWLDDGAQAAYPYAATFTEAPAPNGWGVVLNSLEASVAYQSTITIPPSFRLGVYTLTVGDGHGKIYEREFEVIPAPPKAVEIVQSACYNGLDMVREVQVRLRESLSTTAQQQSMLYERHVRRTLDEIARRTWTISDTVVCDLISGQVEYQFPSRPFEIRTVSINDGNGNIFDIAGITAEEAGQMFPLWQNTGVNSVIIWNGIPGYYIDEVSRFWLLPTPNYNQQAGLIIRGSVGVDKWYTLDMCLPLGEGFDELVMLGTAFRRCEEMAPIDPIYQKALPMYQDRYEILMRRHYRERINRTEATRNQIPTNGRSWGGGWCFANWGYG